MSVPGAIVAGLVATLIFYVVTRLSTMNLMGPERYLGTIFTESENRPVGFALLFACGVAFAFIYAGLWSVGVGWPGYRWGLVFGIVQWLLLGLFPAILPPVHVGIRTGAVPSPGLYMTRLLGWPAFPAGLVNHAIFGLVIAYFYQFFMTRYG